MHRALYLGIDTSTAWGSLGLIDDEGVRASSTLRLRSGHAKGLASRIEALLKESGAIPQDLAGIGVVNGPGSFTALRVGVSTAQGLGMGLGIPVVPVGSLEAVAAGLPPVHEPVLVLIPARKGEVFAQVFSLKVGIGGASCGVLDCLRLEQLGSFVGQAGFVAGSAADVYAREIEAIFGSAVLPVPLACRGARGETVAVLARERIRHGVGDYSADQVAIRYLQSHGALTVEERSKGRAVIDVKPDG
jgi:tRNA threonylcarbamoyladenosine biosynthesis protein TsaB